MRKRTTGLVLTAFLFSGPAAAGPLTNIFLGSLDGHGEASWSEGYQQGRVETLTDVVLRMEDGRRYDISTLTLNYEGTAFLLEAENVRMNPEGDILLLKADRISYSGHAGFLETFWSHEMVTDACAFIGPDSRVMVEDFGLILSGRGDLLSEDSMYRAALIDLAADMSGDSEACKVDLDFTMQGYEAFLSDGSSNVAERLDVEASLPGSLASLAADPGQDVTFKIKAHEARDLISGGATAWSIEDGVANARFSALGLVPALTLSLKYQELGYGPEYWMRLWNSLERMRGEASVDIDNMTARSANVLPPEYVTRFTDAGLTTLLLDMEGRFDVAGKAVDLVTTVDATGLMDAEVEAGFRLGAYPREAIARQSGRPIPFDGVLPIYLDELHYAHTDDGLIDSAANIMGVPVTVRINQIREVQSEKSPSISPVIRRIATEAANFAALSYRDPPARLDLSIGEGLDLREALIVSGKAPAEIPNIFTFSISSGARGEAE